LRKGEKPPFSMEDRSKRETRVEITRRGTIKKDRKRRQRLWSQKGKKKRIEGSGTKSSEKAGIEKEGEGGGFELGSGKAHPIRARVQRWRRGGKGTRGI